MVEMRGSREEEEEGGRQEGGKKRYELSQRWTRSGNKKTSRKMTRFFFLVGLCYFQHLSPSPLPPEFRCCYASSLPSFTELGTTQSKQIDSSISSPPSSPIGSWTYLLQSCLSGYDRMCQEVADYLWPYGTTKEEEEKEEQRKQGSPPASPPDAKRTYRVHEEDGSFSLVADSSTSSPDHSNPLHDFRLFVEAVNWSEPFLISLCSFHILLFLFILFFSKTLALYVQCSLLLVLCVCIYLTQPLGKLAHAHWTSLVAEPYFDPRGPFVLLVWATPLLLSLFTLVLQLLVEASRMLVVVKREQLRRQKGETAVGGGGQKHNEGDDNNDNNNNKVEDLPPSATATTTTTTTTATEEGGGGGEVERTKGTTKRRVVQNGRPAISCACL
eukprot:GHVS01065645.1.p1 GENE.GHVS01065645.1~~GHVS01065645.1.p1  ORF type:complete len:385 (+),score=119.91 GHVS01065645.1:127-1281(+)